MKYYQFLLIIILGISFYNCYEEAPIVAEEIPYKRVQMYDTNSTDKVLNFVSRYYYKYNRFFITDPDSSDYLYNFSSKNESLEFNYPKQEQEHLWKGIEMMQKLVLDAYPEEFIRKHFPYSIILADDAIADPALLETEVLSCIGRYFCIFSIQDLGQMSFNEKAVASSKSHETLWRYIGMYDKGINIPDEFYQYGESLLLYGQLIQDEKLEYLYEEEARYELGFPRMFLFYDIIPVFPYKGEDIGYWISFLIDTPDDELQVLLKKYEVMQIKYDLLTKALKEMGIDYKKLRYTEK
ncbi:MULTISPECIES: hypothetical protein [Butyricimonas]|uniref:hypothetical protein n=1 Tax=Butyricimonas TaxID=574697 RepID=UPI000C0888CC|nr:MULTISPECIES: hypothetical protein [Butyricimonas]MCB6971978.1 hypothetical protein [Butyricimonas synergistica]MCG4518986.1 hypothetical protein [Butyricimonas sp. DFI.6.44]